jgi:hypothetical protein
MFAKAAQDQLVWLFGLYKYLCWPLLPPGRCIFEPLIQEHRNAEATNTLPSVTSLITSLLLIHSTSSCLLETAEAQN